ncbi:hypothetical protein [Bradyrhizobium sp. SEMIA]|uniref:hypothetical protein n=1 Tax=Bradyrhizobium sp. SEMIA TaxID=2597515 RepID=UPI0018A61964|nr:hypothetical protein [Bradyrhizobium sp. SEMIA]QOG19136.1 hypothetical protein FOM02_19070 [Bradyrhizobium sp. SEMIA]
MSTGRFRQGANYTNFQGGCHLVVSVTPDASTVFRARFLVDPSPINFNKPNLMVRKSQEEKAFIIDVSRGALVHNIERNAATSEFSNQHFDRHLAALI